MNLFIASYRFGRSVTELYRASLPFMLVLLVALVLITYVPWLSLGLL
jgi:TRAP-type C4-dicarboxylate transport system permease large subunit